MLYVSPMSGTAQIVPVITLVTAAVFGQVPRSVGPPDSTPEVVFRSETALSLLSFHVSRNGKFSGNIEAKDIEIRQDGIPQRIAIFEGGKSPRQVKTEIMLLFDCSGSMKHEDILKPQLFKFEILDPYKNVNISLLAFDMPVSGNQVARFTKPTRDMATLRTGMRRLSKYGGHSTDLYGSILVTLREAATGSDDVSRMLVIVSDGLSTDRFRHEAVEASRSLGIPLYPVLRKYRMKDLQPFLRYGKTHEETGAERTSSFARVASETGGWAFPAAKNEKDLLPEILTALADLVRTEYVVGFYPVISDVKKVHRLQVVLKSSELGVLHAGSRNARY